MKHRWILAIGLTGMFLGCMSCSEPAPEAADSTAAAEAEAAAKVPLERETTLGPVHAVVRLDNSEPVLGEQIELTLTVDAAPDVVVTMPEFGDQMAKFGIADFKETEDLRDDGRFIFSQKYTLDLPMSGKLRTPSFLVEFTDNRSEAENPGKIQELLTEEMTFDVKSVFGEGEVPDALAPALGELPELVLPDGRKTPWWLYIGLGVLGIVLIGLAIAISRRRRPEIVLPPDVVALSALDKLASRDIPDDNAGIDAWYVELSGIVRCYVEGRFALNAPRLTTEEFFELAKRSAALEDGEKVLICRLLERSDRVKFTNFMPSKEETAQMLVDARRFVKETSKVEEEGADHA